MKIKLRKKTLISFAVALAMVISFMPGNALKSLAADAVELSQADFDAAKAGTPTKGITCASYSSVDLYGLDEGSYILTENIDLGTTGVILLEDNQTVELDLDGKTLKSAPPYPFIETQQSSKMTIKGNGIVDSGTAISVSAYNSSEIIIENGTFSNAFAQNDSKLTINNGTFNNTSTSICARQNGNITINNATANGNIYSQGCDDSMTEDGTPSISIENITVSGGAIYAIYGSITINNATVTSANSDAVYVLDKGSAVINDGVFDASNSESSAPGMSIESWGSAEPLSVEINGGTFTGHIEPGVSIGCSTDLVKISKGTFRCDSADGYGGISIVGTDTSKFNDILAEGSSYSPALETGATEYISYTQQEISVVKAVTKYTVTFYDGDKKLDEKTVEDGSKVAKPASAPTKDGYTFAGWFSDKDLKTEFDFDKAITDNTNIYAKWTKNEEPTPEEPTPEEPTPEEPTPEEPTPEKPTPEKPTPEEPTPEEPTPVDPAPATGTLTKVGIYCAQDNPSIIAAFLTERSVEADTVEYRWLACEESNPNAWFVVSDWTKGNYYLSWTPEKSGDYIIVAQARLVGNEEKTLVYDSFGVNFRTVNAKIKDICQMPYEGGYLIGIESTANPNQSLKYEMLVMDLSLYAAGNPNCWVHSVKGGVAEGNALWTIWEPQYGYYVTLFRIYDANDNLLDETAYGFANAY